MMQVNQWGLPYTNLRLSPSLVPMLGHDPRWGRTYPIESTAELVTAPSRCQPVPMMCPAVASGWIPHQFWVCCVGRGPIERTARSLQSSELSNSQPTHARNARTGSCGGRVYTQIRAAHACPTWRKRARRHRCMCLTRHRLSVVECLIGIRVVL